MKRRFLLFFLPAIVLFMPSCDESHLDLEPLDPGSEVHYFNDQERLDELVLGVYMGVSKLYRLRIPGEGGVLYPLWLLPADDLTTYGYYPYETFDGLEPGDKTIDRYFNSLYLIINRANTALELVRANREVYRTESLYDIHRGEALFLRAFAHFRLANTFGDVIIRTERITRYGMSRKQQSPFLEVLDQCIEDLLEAASLLPAEWDVQWAGRLTSDAAYGMLGKVYVFRACYGNNPVSDYRHALDAFGNISSSVALAGHYGDNFDVSEENNQESLFEFQATSAWNFFCTVLGKADDECYEPAAYWGFFDNIYTWGILGDRPFMPTGKLTGAFHPQDPRTAEIFSVNNRPDWSPHGYEFVKYTKRGETDHATMSMNNPRILRHADVMLLEAEARLQTGDEATATFLVNRIRKRARESVPDTVSASYEPAGLPTVTMQDIMDERFRELCGEESHRWFDLKRWDAAGYIDLSDWSGDKAGFSSVRTDFNFEYPENLFYPIPLNELDYNTEAVQNPGY